MSSQDVSLEERVRVIQGAAIANALEHAYNGNHEAAQLRAARAVTCQLILTGQDRDIPGEAREAFVALSRAMEHTEQDARQQREPGVNFQ